MERQQVGHCLSMAQQRQKREGADFFKPRIATRSGAPDGEGAECSPSELMKGQKEIIAMLQGLTKKVDKMDSRMSALENRFGRVESSLKEMETRVATLEVSTKEFDAHRKDMQQLQEKVATSFLSLDPRIEHLENARRAGSVRVLGVPPLDPAEDLKSVLNSLINEQLGGSDCEPKIAFRKAFRIPSKGRGRETANGSGTVIASLMYPDDRDELLKRAAVKKKVMLRDTRVLFFPDLAPFTQARRKEMLEVRQKLMQYQVQASVQQPARLRTDYKGQRYLFSQVTAAKDFLAKVEADLEDAS